MTAWDYDSEEYQEHSRREHERFAEILKGMTEEELIDNGLDAHQRAEVLAGRVCPPTPMVTVTPAVIAMFSDGVTLEDMLDDVLRRSA